MTTSLFQIEALRRKRRVSLKTVVNETLRRGLADVEAPKRQIQDVSDPRFRCGKPLTPSIENVAEALASAKANVFR
ncbi:MAG: hypothetical protein WDM85_16405 [Caulobacteraceae bacterium]